MHPHSTGLTNTQPGCNATRLCKFWYRNISKPTGLAGQFHYLLGVWRKNPNPKETHSTLITKPRQLEKMPEAHLIYSWAKLNARTLSAGRTQCKQTPSSPAISAGCLLTTKSFEPSWTRRMLHPRLEEIGLWSKASEFAVAPYTVPQGDRRCLCASLMHRHIVVTGGPEKIESHYS